MSQNVYGIFPIANLGGPGDVGGKGLMWSQCCAILIGIGAKSVLKSKIFDTFGIVSVLVLKEVCKRYWYWSRYCKKSLRGIGIGIGIET